MTANTVQIYYTEWKPESGASHRLLQEAVSHWLGCEFSRAPDAGQGISRRGAELTEDDIARRTPHGKPYLPAYPDVHFSISHSGCWWAVAISEVEAGLDLQKTEVGRWERVAGRFFHPDEVRWLEGRTREDFCLLWAYKESYLKFTGEGFARSLGSFSAVNGGSLTGVSGVKQQPVPFPDPGYRMVLTTLSDARAELVPLIG